MRVDTREGITRKIPPFAFSLKNIIYCKIT
nr:MAG TPA: hypothetical protein [Caudoviricetes sp.]